LFRLSPKKKQTDFDVGLIRWKQLADVVECGAHPTQYHK
jgi:hypothetical protein